LREFACHHSQGSLTCTLHETIAQILFP
jgi:hypothetical protein